MRRAQACRGSCAGLIDSGIQGHTDKSFGFPQTNSAHRPVTSKGQGTETQFGYFDTGITKDMHFHRIFLLKRISAAIGRNRLFIKIQLL